MSCRCEDIHHDDIPADMKRQADEVAADGDLKRAEELYAAARESQEDLDRGYCPSCGADISGEGRPDAAWGEITGDKWGWDEERGNANNWEGHTI